MKYVTGKHALNLECNLNTFGDWHTSALAWKDIHFKDSDLSIFKEWGIEDSKRIPNGESYPVADHLRAILDLLDGGMMLRWLKGFRREFIGVDEYNQVFFEKVLLLRRERHWEPINSLMSREYGIEWMDFESKERNKLVKMDIEKLSVSKLLREFMKTKGIKDLEIILEKVKNEKKLTGEDYNSFMDYFYYQDINYWEYEITTQYYHDIDKDKLLSDLRLLLKEYKLI